MTKIIKPCANPQHRTCDITGCPGEAVADAKTSLGPWAYLCIGHLQTHGTRNTDLINNITKEDLELSWL